MQGGGIKKIQDKRLVLIFSSPIRDHDHVPDRLHAHSYIQGHVMFSFYMIFIAPPVSLASRFKHCMF